MPATPQTLFPVRVRRWLIIGSAVVVLCALALIFWRGSAILLDISAFGTWLGCF